MEDLLTLSVSAGLMISLIFTEVFGVAPGGLIVPGYFALFLDKPLNVVLTMLAGLVTYGLVQALSSVMILYGRRRTVLMILMGYIVGTGLRYMIDNALWLTPLNIGHFSVIGYIVPGLIAIWFDRQGVVTTASTLIIVSIIVRLALIMTIGTDINI